MGLGRIDEAMEIFVSSVKLMRTQPNPDPIAIASSLATLGQCQLVAAKFEDAEGSFRESTELFTKFLPEAWPTFVYRSNTGIALTRQRKFSEAEPILLESFEAIKARRASVPPELYIDAIKAIIEFYEATENPGEVERWSRELVAPAASEGGTDLLMDVVVPAVRLPHQLRSD